MRILTILLIFAMAFMSLEVYQLREEIQVLKKINFFQGKNPDLVDQHRRIALKFRSTSTSVFSIRCHDSKKKKPAYWWGSGFKATEDTVVTAMHVINKELMPDSKEKNFYPVLCDFYSEGEKIGDFKTDAQNFKQVSSRDLVLLKVNFNALGKKLSPLALKVNHDAYEGEPLFMISHPGNFIDDFVIAFGYVLNRNTNKIQHPDRIEPWKDAILTDMVATGGSSGAPVLNMDEEVIGIHVGGDLKNNKFRSNYQLLFNTQFFLDLQWFKMQSIDKPKE